MEEAGEADDDQVDGEEEEAEVAGDFHGLVWIWIGFLSLRRRRGGVDGEG